MKRSMWICVLFLTACGMASTGLAQTPSFSLAWSEYPSWSTFGVANELKIINGQKGEMGPIEKKWNVDIELKEAEYDPCLTMYGSGQCDAVCITNMDVLNPSLTRASVAMLPTSTSFGADACLVTSDITSADLLKGKKVYGLAKSVSEYCFVRNLQIQNKDEKQFEFSNMDPGAAAVAMQQKQAGYDAIMVWNPFVLDTLNKRKDVKVLFDSTTIPGEIIDMVVVAQASLDQSGGKAFAMAVMDTFYAINQRMADPKTADDTLIALGEKFSNLDLNSMRTVVKQTKFYATPQEGINILTSKDTETIMKTVVDFCVSHEIVAEAPAVAFADKTKAPKAVLRFDPTYLKEYAAKAGK